ncbi:RlmE family RNA methyltransferase [Zavarzinia sp. CC-PAN008]|uniref:RlmE family RNA methyltransferase n=1 Tax=Zavarzinia sp. CC-PAN008 TaxID=3243332 RepID=UPI003F743AC3
MAGSGTGKPGGRAGAKGAAGARAGGGTPTGVGQARTLKERVKTARKRTLSSTLWLQRQLNDPYVHAAKAQGYRSRAAFKLVELDEKFELLRPGAVVLDLGAAPGGWTQVAVAKVGPKGRVLGVDINPMDAVPGADVMQLDFLAEDAPEKVRAALGGASPDIVLSDMAAPATGHKQTDHLRIIALCEVAVLFAVEVLAPGGAFVAKVLQGGTQAELLALLKQNFAEVKHAKPKASRADSAEMYVVAKGLRRTHG